MSNEISTLTKFLFSTLNTDTYWIANFKNHGTMSFPEVVPRGISLSIPQVVFSMSDGNDIRGAFGMRLFVKTIYQIKAIISGEDFAPLADAANQIDRLYDWTNQIDPAAGRPRSQEQYTNPETGEVIQIMGMIRDRPVKYTTYSEGTTYCHLGGEYLIDFYKV